MKRYYVNVGYMVPCYATMIVEAENECEAEKVALNKCWEDVPAFDQYDHESGGPGQVFDVWESDGSTVQLT